MGKGLIVSLAHLFFIIIFRTGHLSFSMSVALLARTRVSFSLPTIDMSNFLLQTVSLIYRFLTSKSSGK